MTQEISPEEFGHSFWLLRFFLRFSRKSAKLRALLILAIFAIIPLPCFLASWLDSTLFLSKLNSGRGLIEHPAFWALFISGPIIVLLLFSLFRQMSFVVNLYCSPERKHLAPECRERVLDLLTCRTPPLKVIYYCMVVCGAYAVLANFQNTRIPLEVFRQDVWDSVHHLRGFLIAKIFLIFQWMYLFPLVIYLGIASSVCILLIVREIAAKRSVEISSFEPDGCGGFRLLGQAMIVVINLNLPFALVVAADIQTHRSFYTTIALATLLLIGLICFEIFVPFIELHRLLSKAKNTRLDELSELIKTNELALGDSAHEKVHASFLRILAAVEIYKQTQRLHTWPYLRVDRLKWLGPLVPLGLSLVRRLVTP